MNTEIKYIENLEKAKTKYAIASALDFIHPYGKFTLLVDCFSKKRLVELKLDTLNDIKNMGAK